MIKYLLIFLTFFSSLSADSFIFDAQEQDPITVSVSAETPKVQPGKPVWVAVHLELEEGWHTYWKNPGEGGMPPSIEWELPEGFTVGQVLWPIPEVFELDGMKNFGYAKAATLLVEVITPEHWKGNVILTGEFYCIVCNEESCFPFDQMLSFSLAPGTSSSATRDVQNLFSQARAALPQHLESLHVSHQKPLVLIEFSHEQEIASAQFFPEEEESVNISTTPKLMKVEGKENRYQLVLEEGDNFKNLRGVLTLYTEASSYPIAGYVVGHTAIEGNAIAFNGENQNVAATHAFTGGVLMALGLAFLGGILLNLMPCVLPVISFKVLSFVKMAGENRIEIFKHGLAFSAGVILSFWVLAGALLSLQAYGHAVGWGFQLQEPLFVAVLAAIIFIFGLSLFGVFEMGTGLAAKAGGQTSSQDTSWKASFFSGVLATAVATPCTGPFLGTAVGFAVTQPPLQALSIFTSLGLGMASPYLLLAAFPQLLRFFPKPGAWMVVFKEAMGFVMLATVVWLMWVFTAQTGVMAVPFLLAGFLSMAIGCWIYGKWASPIRTKRTRWIGMAFATLFLLFGGYGLYVSSGFSEEESFVYASEGEIAMASPQVAVSGWERFSPERVAALREQGVPVFIDFTAKWCLICQANHLVLDSAEVVKAFADAGVVRMKADWTKRDSVITEALKEFGRNSVPLYVLYGEGKPNLLPQVLTVDIVMEQLRTVSR